MAVRIWSIDAIESKSDRGVTDIRENMVRNTRKVEGNESLIIKGHMAPLNSVCFNGDGAKLISASDDNTLRVWNASTGRQELTLRGHSSATTNGRFSPDGRYILSVGDDGVAKVWDAAVGQKTPTIECLTVEEQFKEFSFSRDLKTVVGRGKGGVYTWNPDTRTCSHLINEIKNDFYKPIACSSDGRRVASVIRTGNFDKVAIWDSLSGVEMASFLVEVPQASADFRGSVSGLLFSPNGQSIAGFYSAGPLCVWDASTGEQTFISKERYTRYMAFSPDGQKLVSVKTYSLTLFDMGTGSATLEIQTRVGWLNCVAFSDDGKRIAGGFKEGTVVIWDVASGNESLTYRGHSPPVNCVAFSPDGKRVVSGSGRGTVRVWDATDGEDCMLMTEHRAPVQRVAFSSDGRRIISASEDGTIKIWDATNKE